jgi:hypothetical protein
MKHFLHPLYWQTFTFELMPMQRVDLPKHLGPSLHGLLGHAFRRLVCHMGPIPCRTCMLHDVCVYPQVFEPLMPEGKIPHTEGLQTAPRPYVIYVPNEPQPRWAEPDQPVTFMLTLVGKWIEYLPYFIAAFKFVGRLGLGRNRARFYLNKISVIKPDGNAQLAYDGRAEKSFTGWKPTYFADLSDQPTSEPLRIKFQTPVRLKRDGQLIDEITPRLLFLHLLRRLGQLAVLHCGADPLPEQEFTGVLAAAKNIEMPAANLHWEEWPRFSSRQQARMKLGGMVGEVSLRGPQLPVLMPLLQLAEVLHVGKATTFGLGKVRLG